MDFGDPYLQSAVNLLVLVLVVGFIARVVLEIFILLARSIRYLRTIIFRRSANRIPQDILSKLKDYEDRLKEYEELDEALKIFRAEREIQRLARESTRDILDDVLV